MSPLILGIDIGGTFTDPIMMHGDGDAAVVKAPSMPRDPRLAVESGISLLAKRLGLRATYDGEVETALNLDSLAQSLHSAGYWRDVLVMQSHGGVLPAAAARDLAVGAILSGPAGVSTARRSTRICQVYRILPVSPVIQYPPPRDRVDCKLWKSCC